MCGVLSNEPIFVQFNTTSDSYHGEQFPFLSMTKMVAEEETTQEKDFKMSPFDYKRSEIDFWTPPDFAKDKDKD